LLPGVTRTPERRPLHPAMTNQGRRRQVGREIARNTDAIAPHPMPSFEPPATPFNAHPAQPHSWIGARFRRVSEARASQLGMQGPTGVLVVGLDRDGPAANAKLQVDDVITSFNGTVPDDPTSLARAIQKMPVGDTVYVEVWRGDQVLPLEITTAEDPADQARAGLADGGH
jgi:S1-C subfamily serine protease